MTAIIAAFRHLFFFMIDPMDNLCFFLHDDYLPITD